MVYVKQIATLLGVFLGLSGVIAFVVGRKIRSYQAGKTYFFRSMLLFPILVILFVGYFFLKGRFSFQLPTWAELLGIVVIMLFFASRIEIYFSKRPEVYFYENQLMIITSTRNQFNLDEISGIDIEGDRLTFHRMEGGKNATRYVRIGDESKRRWLLKQCKNRLKEVQHEKKRS